MDGGLALVHQFADDRVQGLADALDFGQLARAHRFLQVAGKGEHRPGPDLVSPHLEGVFPGQLQQEGDLFQDGGHFFLIHMGIAVH